MTLLVAMYHRARAERHGNSPEMLDAHFATLAARCHIVLPGEPCRRDRLNVCLTFDDAYFDFLAIVLPLLRKHRLRALLGVPAGCLLEATAQPPAARLDVATEEAFRAENAHGFCTWTELQSIARTDDVEFAAHGFRHVRLDSPNADLAAEIDGSGEMLQQRLGRRVTSFIFPYGRYSPAALKRAAARYSSVFRIGGATNRNWQHPPIYRVTADNMSSPDELLQPERRFRLHVRRIWNRLRAR